MGSQPNLVSIEEGLLRTVDALIFYYLSWYTGTIAPPGGQGEAALDIELMMGLLGPNQTLNLYQVGETSSLQEPSASLDVVGLLWLLILSTVDELLAALDSAFCSVEGVSGQSTLP